jgi:hypothetical protein
MHMGLWAEARRHGEAALALYNAERHAALRHIYSQDQLVSALAPVGWSLLALGFPE